MLVTRGQDSGFLMVTEASGRPVQPPYSIACEPHLSTLVFDDSLRPGFFLEWDDFPYPPSLRRNGKYYGEVWMTVAFAPSSG